MADIPGAQAAGTIHRLIVNYAGGAFVVPRRRMTIVSRPRLLLLLSPRNKSDRKLSIQGIFSVLQNLGGLGIHIKMALAESFCRETDT